VDIGGYSRELCGGTHVRETGELGFFRIVAESSVAAGVRRIEAVCGMPAYEWTRREHELVQHLAHRFSVSQDELKDRVESLLQKNKALEKQLKEQAAEAAQGQAADLVGKQQDVDGITVIAEVAADQSMDGLRTMMDGLRPKLASGVIVLGGAANGKACFMATVSKDLVERGLHAGQLVGQVAKVAGGGGGGQPNKAQAGGKDAGKVPEAIAQVPEILKCMLS
jgi:alanyl-tRNA synthetase